VFGLGPQIKIVPEKSLLAAKPYVFDLEEGMAPFAAK